MSVTVIAEVGVNHNGEFRIAKKLIDIASKAEADIVKFQTFKTHLLATPNAKKAEYQKNLFDKSDTQIEMLKSLELDQEKHILLFEYAERSKIEFLSTAFDDESLNFLINLGISRFKIPSGEITNIFALQKVAQQNRPIILSTGMSNLKEVENALKVLIKSGANIADITLMHCTSEYPTKLVDVNLNAMTTLKETFGTAVGYSDHTQGFEVAIAAVALGASVIEKHITLDRNLTGPDHLASMEPDEFCEYVRLIRNTTKLLGSFEKSATYEEMINQAKVRKSLVAKKPIRKGEILTENNVTAKRPGDGISPMDWIKISGTIATRNYNENDFIE